MTRLYLASASPRRVELLSQVGVDSQQLPGPAVDERPLKDEPPEYYVQRLAAEKAQAGWVALDSALYAHGAVLGADTAVICDKRILGKPVDPQDAYDMLTRLSGREHQVLSAVSMRTAQGQKTLLSSTDVCFRLLSAEEIHRYIATGEGVDKAGAYGIQGLGALLVVTLNGSYSGVVGLPLEQTRVLLQWAQVAYWQ